MDIYGWRVGFNVKSLKQGFVFATDDPDLVRVTTSTYEFAGAKIDRRRIGWSKSHVSRQEDQNAHDAPAIGSSVQPPRALVREHIFQTVGGKADCRRRRVSSAGRENRFR